MKALRTLWGALVALVLLAALGICGLAGFVIVAAIQLSVIVFGVAAVIAVMVLKQLQSTFKRSG